MAKKPLKLLAPDNSYIKTPKGDRCNCSIGTITYCVVLSSLDPHCASISYHSTAEPFQNTVLAHIIVPDLRKPTVKFERELEGGDPSLRGLSKLFYLS